MPDGQKKDKDAKAAAPHARPAIGAVPTSQIEFEYKHVISTF